MSIFYLFKETSKTDDDDSEIKKFYYILHITVMLVFLDLLIITCLLLFGINSFFHEWTPENNHNEEGNVFIYWSFWIQCISLLLAIIGSINLIFDYHYF